MEPNNSALAEALSENEATAEKAERRTIAESIVSLGAYPEMLEAFARQPGLLEEMTADLKHKEEFLIAEAPYLSEGDWRALTCLELFDRATFEHCERTWALAKEKLESEAAVGAYFRERLDREGLSVETVLRACLLHDCGKMCLEKRVLNDAHTDGEWNMAYEKFCLQTYGQDGAQAAIAELDAYLGTHPGNRAIHKVPFEALAFLGETEQQLVGELVAKGVDVSLPLATLIESHQERSGDTLAFADRADPAVALVANHHPKRPITEEEYPAGLSVVRMGMAVSEKLNLAVDIIRLSDIFDAYHSPRAYKPGHPNLATLEYLMREADRGNIDASDATEWVKDSVAHLEREEYFSAFAEYVERAQIEGANSEAELRTLKKQFSEERLAYEQLRSRGIIELANNR